jgi:hypothetical protein
MLLQLTLTEDKAQKSHLLGIGVDLAPYDDSLNNVLDRLQGPDQPRELGSCSEDDGNVRMADDVLHSVLAQGFVQRDTPQTLAIAGLDMHTKSWVNSLNSGVCAIEKHLSLGYIRAPKQAPLIGVLKSILAEGVV